MYATVFSSGNFLSSVSWILAAASSIDRRLPRWWWGRDTTYFAITSLLPVVLERRYSDIFPTVGLTHRAYLFIFIIRQQPARFARDASRLSYWTSKTLLKDSWKTPLAMETGSLQILSISSCAGLMLLIIWIIKLLHTCIRDSNSFNGR